MRAGPLASGRQAVRWSAPPRLRATEHQDARALDPRCNDVVRPADVHAVTIWSAPQDRPSQ